MMALANPEERTFMKTRTALTIGFFAGVFVGGAVTLLEVAPTAVAILMTPLKWLIGAYDEHPQTRGHLTFDSVWLPIHSR
jgi:hypothetical protein